MKESKKWSDPSILKVLPNPSKRGYEIKHTNPELTFLGSPKQPDIASIVVLFYPAKTIIELRSLKEYFYQFRTTVISYERLLDVIYEDLMTIYAPARLRLEMTTNPRGGISSELVIDSDWSINGGEEKFKDWVGK